MHKGKLAHALIATAAFAAFAPTQAQLESLQTLQGDMASANTELRQILQSDLPVFNQSLVNANLTPLLYALDERQEAPAPRAR